MEQEIISTLNAFVEKGYDLKDIIFLIEKEEAK